MISESDWKKFTVIKKEALERFCQSILQDASNVIHNQDNSTNQERYLDLYQLIINKNKDIADVFDDHRRSTADLQLMVLRANGLVQDEHVQSLSDDIKQRTDPNRYR